MKIVPTLLAVVVFAAGATVSASASDKSADTKPGLAGHWEGAIQLPNRPLPIAVDLVRGEDGTWSGTIDNRAHGMRGAKLSEVKIDGVEVTLKFPAAPGDPMFRGKHDTTADILVGEFTQGTVTFPCEFERKERSVDTLPATPEHGVAGKGLAGNWQGTLPVGNAGLRLVLKVAAGAEEKLTGSIDSLDQDSGPIAIATISTAETSVRLELPVIGGVFEGKFNDDGSELAGTWSQGGGSLPLVFKRLPAAGRQ